MHNIVFVLLPPDTADILGSTNRLLAPFSINLEVAPHKRRPNERDINYWKEKFHKDDLNALAEDLRKEIGLNYGVDEEGLYEVTTFNEMGRWDDWWPMKYFKNDPAKASRWGQKLAQSICLASALSEKDIHTPHSMLTPDGKWHDVDDFGYNTALQFLKGVKGLHPDNFEPIAKWESHVRRVLAIYSDHVLLVLDYHF